MYVDPRLREYASYGQGNGPIHMANVGCTGEEESIFGCRYVGADSHYNCEHYDDVDLKCAGKFISQVEKIQRHTSYIYDTISLSLFIDQTKIWGWCQVFSVVLAL